MESEQDLVEVFRHQRRELAEERGLVLMSMGIPHSVIQIEGDYGVFVEGADTQRAAQEIARFEAERLATPPKPAPIPLKKTPVTSLFVFAWVLIGFFAMQSQGKVDWLKYGASDSDLVLKGEWWRVFTALTLHADVPHVVANLAVGLVFAGSLLPWFGLGWTWFGIVLSGGLGNLLNAWGYRHEPHSSIGASTAVFGALGMLVGHQVATAILAHRRLTAQEVWFPIAAGLSLLAYLGVNGDHVDFMAHGFGLIAGVAIGAALTCVNVADRTPRWLSGLLALFALAVPFLSWWLALSSEK